MTSHDAGPPPAGPPPAGPPPAELPDEAFAAALASLPDMTPQRLRRMLGDRPASEVCDELLGGSERLVESLLDLVSFSRAGGARAARGQLALPPGIEVASDLERRRARIGEVLAWWRSELQSTGVGDRWAELGARGIAVVRRGRSGYPTRLLRSPAPPELLYVRGRLDHAEQACVGIVGTRRATHYGREVAGEFGAVLAELGVVVVSGLARGIDSAAHEGALVPAGGAAPLAVAGTGVDRVFPAGNERLWARVAEAGGIVSESPPGAPPEGWRFPLRNRIIAALSEVLVVVESSRQGGAMHTVQAADDIGVPVLAVPGSIRSPQSEGTNAVIRDGGAGLAADVDDVLAALALARAGSLEPPVAGAPGGQPPRRTGRGRAGRSSGSGQPSRSASRARPPSSRAEQLLRLCSDSERTVYGALDEVVSTVDAVCQRCGLSLGSVVLALDRLEELGLAAHVGASWVRR